MKMVGVLKKGNKNNKIIRWRIVVHYSEHFLKVVIAFPQER